MNIIKTNQTKNQPSGTVYQMAAAGLMAALTCMAGPLSLNIPVSPVPISLTNLVIYLSVYLLGKKLGTVSYLVYLLLGFAGLPVFSGFTGGAGKLLGPTGGYLIGFIGMAYLCGSFLEQRKGRGVDFAGMVSGTIVAYLFGTLWLSRQAGMTFLAALAAGVLPFVPGDLVKIALILFLGPKVRSQLGRAGISFYGSRDVKSRLAGPQSREPRAEKREP